MNKKILFILIVLIGICTISNASATNDSDIISSDNSTFIETQPIEDTLAINEHHITPEDDIQDTLDKANESDTIILNGTFKIKNTINIDKKINILGDSATIQWDSVIDKSQIFNIKSDASNVVLSNLKLIYGNGKLGGAILWEGSDGTISNCELVQNMAKENYGGAIVLKGNNCKITDCTFKGNEAKDGGAILANGDNCQITNCTFYGNTATHYGGAIMLEANNCRISNCTFNQNSATQSGGAIFVRGKGNIISNSKFNNNRVMNPINESVSGGGAIFSDCDGITINQCDFNGGIAQNSNGGAINIIDDGRITNSSFKDNSALFGNAIYSSSRSLITSNYFVIAYNESEEDAVNITEKEYMRNDNKFDRIKIASSVDFSASMIFEYGSAGSIYVIVDGGKVLTKNIRVLNHKEAKIKFSNNELKVSGLNVGTYTLRVTTTPDENHTATDRDLKITVKKAVATISASKLTVALKSSAVWSIKIINKHTKNPIANMKLTLKVYTGKNYKKVQVKTNSKGIASYKTKNLAAGTHKIVVTGTHSGYTFNTVSSSIKVIKQTPLKFTLQKRVSDKDGAILSYIVSNKKTSKGINGIKIKVLIYTGKKYRTYVLKTKKIKGNTKTYNGAFGFSTNDFTKGKHIVKLVPYNLKYKGSAKSYIVIKKSATKGETKFFRSI